MPASEQNLADLDLLKHAAAEAGALTLRYFRQDPKAWSKDGGSPVSEADHASDALLHELLIGARPDYGWLSEESDDDPTRVARQRVFVIDPIDGTRAFLRGEPAYAIAIAVVEEGCPVAGVIHLPARGETYAACLGGGAAFERKLITQEIAGDFEQPNLTEAPLGRIRVSTRTRIDGAKTLITRPNLSPDLWRRTPPRVAPLVPAFAGMAPLPSGQRAR